MREYMICKKCGDWGDYLKLCDDRPKKVCKKCWNDELKRRSLVESLASLEVPVSDAYVVMSTLEDINPYGWEGDITAKNIDQVREVLRSRMPTRHIAISQIELFSADNLSEGDHAVFTPENVTLSLVYGIVSKEYKTIVIPGNTIARHN
jgi:hypothetical protein